MKKIVWNTNQNREVPYNDNLDVEGNPNLEWREVDDGSVEAVEEVVEAAPAKAAAPRKRAPSAKKK